MEPADWLHPYLDAPTRERFPLVWTERRRGHDARSTRSTGPTALHHDPAYRAEDAAQITLRKNFLATGSFLNDDRAGRARPARLREPARVRHVHEPARVALRPRRRPRARGHDRARAAPRRARLVLGRSAPAAGHGRSRRRHRGRGRSSRATRSTRAARRSGSGSTRPVTRRVTSRSNRCGPRARRPGVPVVLHVAGAGANVMALDFFDNGLPPVPDFHGGDTNFKSIDYLSIPLPVMQTLNALIIDGVLMRYPALRIGVIELGATWVPGWMRSLDSAHEAFRKNEDAPAGDGPAPERVRAAPGAGHAVSARGHGLDDREHRRRRVHVLVRLPARRGRPQSDRPLRTQHRRRGHRRRRAASASTSTTSSTCSARCSTAAASSIVA